MALKPGDKCPEFSLPDQNGNQISIDSFFGKKIIILFFYPKDYTSGCTKEVCLFRDNHQEFKEMGCEVIGISSDSVNTHASFSQKHELPYILLSDKKKEVRKLFGVPGNLFGLIPGRVTYVIDLKGQIVSVHNSLTDPSGHLEKAKQVVAGLIE
jgi:peroxiredoxin Q/BCP